MRKLLLLLTLTTRAAACEMTPALYDTTVTASRTVGLEPELLSALLWQESRYCHRDGGGLTTSSAGALGVGQLMPDTAALLGVDPYDVEQNVAGAARYLKAQWTRFGSWPLALAAYNAGPGNVEKYGGVPPFEETQRYVQNVLDTYATLKGATATTPVSAVVLRKERRTSASFYRPGTLVPSPTTARTVTSAVLVVPKGVQSAVVPKP